MTTFWIVAAILILAAVATVVVPLLRRAAPAAAPDAEHSNLSILVHQLAELEADVESGTLGADEFAEGRLELERRLLEETAATGESEPPRAGPRSLALAVLAGLAIPAAALLLYLQLGRLDAIVATDPPHMNEAAGPSMAEVVRVLAERLESQPDDSTGWLMLARSYTFLQDFPKAAAAWERAHSLVGDQPDLLAAWADARIMAGGGRFDPESRDLLGRALEIDPDHVKALWMSGTAAFDSGDYPKAIEIWEHLAESAPQDSELAQVMASNLADARALALSTTTNRTMPTR